MFEIYNDFSNIYIYNNKKLYFIKHIIFDLTKVILIQKYHFILTLHKISAKLIYLSSIFLVFSFNSLHF